MEKPKLKIKPLIFFKKQKNHLPFPTPARVYISEYGFNRQSICFSCFRTIVKPQFFYKFDLSFTNSQGAGGCRLDGPNGQQLLIPGLSFPT